MNPARWPASPAEGDFPVAAGLVFGAGIGGFFDGIVLRERRAEGGARFSNDAAGR